MLPVSEPISSPEPNPEGNSPRGHDLPLAWRVFFVISGWILFLIGVAGLALPGIQGILTILLGLALIGLASHTAHSILERLLSRFPAVWDRMEAIRDRIIDKLEQ